MKRGFRGLLFLLVFLTAVPAPAAAGYRSVLGKWTRHDRVFVWENLEARMVWHATYLSPGFREARREKISRLYEWGDKEQMRAEDDDRREEGRYDVFFLGIYAGSSQFPEVGKDSGRWRIVLEAGEGGAIEPVLFERIPVTQLERTLYPYLDKWTEAYLVRFPKVIGSGEGFRLRMTGLPARSELVWK